jgi:hypothetical protein
MARNSRKKTFAADQCSAFEEAANPHAWLLSAEGLHSQACTLWANRREQGILTQYDGKGQLLMKWDITSKANFLLCAFAIENIIKGYLIFENPDNVRDGQLSPAIKSHKLTSLADSAKTLPKPRHNKLVLKAFEAGNEIWMRYPCGGDANDLEPQPNLTPELWERYIWVMQRYISGLEKLLGRGWKGPHGWYGRFTFDHAS